jgi:hypothetical protein
VDVVVARVPAPPGARIVGCGMTKKTTNTNNVIAKYRKIDANSRAMTKRAIARA